MLYRTLLFVGLPMFASFQAHAQVSTDPRALEPLRSATPAPSAGEAPAPSTRGRQPLHRPVPPAAPPARATNAVFGPPRPPAATAVPVAPPPGPIIPPAITVPTRPSPPSPPSPVVADAPGEASRTTDGLRVSFGNGRADLNQTTESALRGFIHGVPAVGTVFTLTSSASAQADDPSTPRRLALSRALGVRSVLIAEGVASPRIIVKVVGALDGSKAGDPADRVDIAVAPSTQSGARPAVGAAPADASAKP